jgi:hypothetical protein
LAHTSPIAEKSLVTPNLGVVCEIAKTICAKAHTDSCEHRLMLTAPPRDW